MSLLNTDGDISFKGPDIHDEWFSDRVNALLEEAEARHSAHDQEDGASERYLMHCRVLIDTALEALQNHSLHNPCGDGEVVALKDGSQMCAGCVDETDAVADG